MLDAYCCFIYRQSPYRSEKCVVGEFAPPFDEGSSRTGYAHLHSILVRICNTHMHIVICMIVRIVYRMTTRIEGRSKKINIQDGRQ